MKWVFLLIIAIGILTACTTVNKQEPANFLEDQEACEVIGGSWKGFATAEKYYCALPDRLTCEKTGGIWKRGGLLGMHHCVHIYPDAKEMCASNDECLGGCIVTSTEETKGTCKETDSPFGCYTFIGGVGICVD